MTAAPDSDLVTLWIPGGPWHTDPVYPQPDHGSKRFEGPWHTDPAPASVPAVAPDVALANRFAAGRQAGRRARGLPLGTPERRAFAAEINALIEAMPEADLREYLAGMSAGMGRPTR